MVMGLWAVLLIASVVGLLYTMLNLVFKFDYLTGNEVSTILRSIGWIIVLTGILWLGYKRLFKERPSEVVIWAYRGACVLWFLFLLWGLVG